MLKESLAAAAASSSRVKNIIYFIICIAIRDSINVWLTHPEQGGVHA